MGQQVGEPPNKSDRATNVSFANVDTKEAGPEFVLRAKDNSNSPPSARGCREFVQNPGVANHRGGMPLWLRGLDFVDAGDLNAGSRNFVSAIEENQN